ncbi:MAG: hypothetical protein A2161_16990 [Candidatus Schekmanbacteria bacterium RBG_13_48_7]|uniref:Gingipain propeptide domain-containing protein n=1 Tax=Candidatus Schekmanbacteria bacterium RBG_13_48_7 TaxID=1817878 RepID=A0A1F7RSW2_9BACT|nr:MAG: hypothetical protein A2161_16990 [Candidatus Schekmanbacteria bacterium RBG_13_48_7]
MKKLGFVFLISLFFASTGLAANDVTYQLTNTPGIFFVSMSGDIPIGIHNLVIFSSSEHTIYNFIEAQEMPDEWELDVQAIYEGMPKINAFIDTPVAIGEDRNFDIKSEFNDDTSLYDDGDGLVFERKTNFTHIEIIVPTGYKVVDLSPAIFTGRSEASGESIMIGENAKRQMISIYVKFVEDDSLIPVYPDVIDSGSFPVRSAKKISE